MITAAEAADRAIRFLWRRYERQPWLVLFQNPEEDRTGRKRTWRGRLLAAVLDTQPDGFRHVVLLAPMGETPHGQRLWLRIDPQSTGLQIGAVTDVGLSEDLERGRALAVPEGKAPPDPRLWGLTCCTSVAAAILKRPFRGLWIAPVRLYARLLAEGAVPIPCGSEPSRGQQCGGEVNDDSAP